MVASAKMHDFLDPPTETGDLGMLGHYRVLGELGKGGMGFVFRAEDTKLKRAVALKVMNKKIAATPNSRRRFVHEARAMAAVHHDNVATIFEVGESNNTPFMAMEMLKGKTLEDFNKQQTQLSFETIIEYAKQLARGLAAAHAKGIVHRDIKPANIWIEQGTDRIKILDFGLALASTPVDHLAGRGAVIGTPGYLSPEQARSEPLDDRSDLYSLGVVLYELCAGQLPILAKSVPGQLISILAHRPNPIGEVNPEIPQPLCDLVHRLLRKEPRTRPSSAALLEIELDRVENECHAKSEVSQAINKLQAGLSAVVSQKSSEDFFESVDEIQESVPDPLAAIPAGEPSMVPQVTPNGAMPHAARKNPATGDPVWKTYWPITAVVGLLVIAIPVLAFSFASTDDSTAMVPAADANQATPTAPKPPPKKPSKPAVQPSQPKSNPPKQSPAKQATPQKQPAKSKPAPPPATKTSAPKVVKKPPVTPPKKPTPPKDPAPITPAPDAPPTVKMKWAVIGTGDGRGADATVQKGTSAKRGMKPNVGVGSRKGIETHHAYLRFDLADIENVRQHIESAELLLPFIASRMEKVKADVQILGVPMKGLWPEYDITWKNSFSDKGVDNLRVLAKVTLNEDAIVEFEERRSLRISTPELAQFAAEAGDTVTFLVTATTEGNEPIRFMSRENPSGKSPKLRVEVPQNPPKKK